MPVLEGSVPDEALRDFSQVLANLQLAYASAAAEDPRLETVEIPTYKTR